MSIEVDDVSGDSKLRNKQKVKEIPFYKYIRNVEEFGGKGPSLFAEMKKCLVIFMKIMVFFKNIASQQLPAKFSFCFFNSVLRTRRKEALLPGRIVVERSEIKYNSAR
jgi:hypothetical protein